MYLWLGMLYCVKFVLVRGVKLSDDSDDEMWGGALGVINRTG